MKNLVEALVERIAASSAVPLDEITILKLKNRPAKNATIAVLIFVGNEDAARYFIKIPRNRAYVEHLLQEYRNLIVLRSLLEGTDLYESIAWPIALEDIGGQVGLIQPALKGRKITNSVRPSTANLLLGRTQRLLEAVTTWLINFHLVSVRQTILTRQHLVPTSAEVRRLMEYANEYSELIHHIIREARSLVGTEAPLSMCHGDFNSHNIILLDNGKLAVLDWEDLTTEAIPLRDVFHFLTVYAMSIPSFSPSTVNKHFQTVFLSRRSAWRNINRCLHRYCQTMNIPLYFANIYYPIYLLTMASKELKNSRIQGDISAKNWLDLAVFYYSNLEGKIIARLPLACELL